MASVEATLLADDSASEEPALKLQSGRSRPKWLIGAAFVVAAGALVFSRSRPEVSPASVNAPTGFLSEVAIEPNAAADEAAAKAEKAMKEAKAAAQKAKDAAAAAKAAEKAAKKAEELGGAAVKLKETADDLHKQADDLESEAEDVKKDSEQTQKKADDERSNAASESKKAEELRKQSEETLAEAKKKSEEMLAEAERKSEELLKKSQEKSEELNKEASDRDQHSSELTQDAKKHQEEADQKAQKADDDTAKSKELQGESEEKRKDAESTEQEALDSVAATRVCVNLGGVKLKGNDLVTFEPLVGEWSAEDDWQCNDWCLRHVECRQSVFTWETKTCELFKGATTEPLTFREKWPWYNSSYCGSISEKDDMLGMLQRVYDQKPWAPPPHNCSWAGENCMSTGCCADVCRANWDFTECSYYTCYKRDENFATCHTDGAPEGWDGYEFDGHPNTEVGPAPEGKLVQGTRLYCFTVVMWSLPPSEGWMNSEAELANNWKDQGKGIMQCDDYSIFDGLDGGSVHNIQSFIRAWNMVKDDGRWKNNDWSIKVDPDAVFFPEHFRSKVAYVWRPPQGTALYMRNTFYKFQFLGAIEALSREGMEIYFERGWECEAHLGQEGGEDYWLQQCLEGLGLNYITDVTLLHDKYAADKNCGDPNSVAHHFFKKVSAWDECWNLANDAWNNAH